MRGPRRASRLTRVVWGLALLAGLIIPALTAGLAREPEAGAAPSAAVFKNPAFVSLFMGGPPLTVNEEVSGIPPGPGLGAFSLGLSFSDSLIQVTVEEGPFLKSTGRATECFTDRLENLLRFYCVSSGLQPGPTGSGVLAYIQVQPQLGLIFKSTVSNGAVALLDDMTGWTALADTLGPSIEIGEPQDSIIILRALEADLNFDCAVNVIDEQMISYRYGASFGALLYDPFFDLEPRLGDNDIDAKDLQFVYGRDTSTCENPYPPQPPGPGPTRTPTPTPTTTRTPTPTATPTVTGTPPTATSTPTATPTVTGTPPTATSTPTPTPTVTGTPPTATSTPTPTPTVTGTPPTATSTPTGTPPTATATRTAIPTATGTAPTATATRTPIPTATGTPPTATASPTATGTPAPTARPTVIGMLPAATSTPAAAAMPTVVGRPPTATAIGGVLPAATPAVRGFPPAGGGPGYGSVQQAIMVGVVLGVVGLALLLASLRRRPMDRP